MRRKLNFVEWAHRARNKYKSNILHSIGTYVAVQYETLLLLSVILFLREDTKLGGNLCELCSATTAENSKSISLVLVIHPYLGHLDKDTFGSPKPFNDSDYSPMSLLVRFVMTSLFFCLVPS